MQQAVGACCGRLRAIPVVLPRSASRYSGTPSSGPAGHHEVLIRPAPWCELSLDPENFQGHLSLGTLYLAAATTETAQIAK